MADYFPNTHWTLLLNAKAGVNSLALRQARESLCVRYWRPLYLYARARGSAAPDAEDAVQGFLARLLEGDRYLQADPGSGKFRSFLLTAFQRYLMDEWDRGQAQKRGGGITMLPLDFASAESEAQALPADVASAEESFDRRWALATVEQALTQLEQRWSGADRLRWFQELKPFLTLDPQESLEAIANRLREKAGTVRMCLKRLREDYLTVIRQTVAETLAPDEDVNDEIRYLAVLLGKSVRG